jgi:flagellar basal-body rod protein FlgB
VVFAVIQTIALAIPRLSCQLKIFIRGGSMLDKLDAALRFGTEALNLRAQRQEILASNIANADTPGYQARDIDFASQLNKVMQNGRAQGSGLALNVTSSRHIEAQTQAQPAMDLLYRIPDQPAADGNTVDMDRERTQFADNSLKYQTDLTLISSQIKGMMSVLQGQ